MSEDVELEVHAGACRFKTLVIGTLQEDGTVKLKIKSECPMVREMASCMPDFDPMDAVSVRVHENPVIVHAGEHLSHPSCPIPVAILKVLESCSGMALKKDVTMNYCSSSR
ncbi:MAG: hypothetical protein PHW93_03535 [Candidatus Methanomethylophilaceae archaeon]|nr:hypothetical protein [Candidatus Methanomethylophilaceae archaeon]